MLVRVSVELPVLLNVTFWGVLLEPTVRLLNERLAGVRLAAGATPVPVSATVCGLPVALSLTLMLAERVPDAVGVKTALMEHDPPAAIELPQLLVCE